MTRTRFADGSTLISTKLWKNGAVLSSKAADSHSAENGHAPTRDVHHQAGRFHHGELASIFEVTAARDRNAKRLERALRRLRDATSDSEEAGP